MSGQIYRIFHFEDEQDKLDWLPGVIFDIYAENNLRLYTNTKKHFVELDDGSLYKIILDEVGVQDEIHFHFIKDLSELNIRLGGSGLSLEYDWVFIDLMKQDEHRNLVMTGIEIYDSIVCSEEFRRLKALFITAYPGRIPERIQERNVFKKPIDVGLLLERIKLYMPKGL